MQGFMSQGGAKFIANGIDGQIVLEFVIGIVGNIAYTATVHDGRFFFF